MCLKREREWERQLQICGFAAGEKERPALLRRREKKQKKNKRERKSLSHLSFLLSFHENEGKSLLCLPTTYALVIYYNSLARSLLHTQTHTCATNPSLSLATAENQHYYHHYHHRSIEEHEGGSDVFFPKHTLMCPPCSNILKNTAWKPKECAASTPLTLSW